jgi:hypothetical protein
MYGLRWNGAEAVCDGVSMNSTLIMPASTSQRRISSYQRRQIVSTVAAIILCTQFQLYMMTQKGESKPKAQWCEEEVDAFLVYLQSQVSKIAGTTFKDETFHEAAKKLVGLQKQGPDKDMVQCKRKWQAVCLCILLPSRITNLSLITLTVETNLQCHREISQQPIRMSLGQC